MKRTEKPRKLGRKTHTTRGFQLIKFHDIYQVPCNLQESSLADRPALWIGVSDVEPMILASKAETYGVKTRKKTGWVPFPVPKDVLLKSRMHMDRDQVIALIGRLQSWVDTGEL